MPTSPRDSEAGLSLVEMLLVLAILALASGLVLGRGSPGRSRLDQAQLASFLSEARSAAMLSGEPVLVLAEEGVLFARQSGVSIAQYRPEGRLQDGGAILLRTDGTSPGGRIAVTEAGKTYGADILDPSGGILGWP